MAWTTISDAEYSSQGALADTAQGMLKASGINASVLHDRETYGVPVLVIPLVGSNGGSLINLLGGKTSENTLTPPPSLDRGGIVNMKVAAAAKEDRAAGVPHVAPKTSKGQSFTA